MAAQLQSDCPHCDSVISVADDEVGRQVECPSCAQAFEVSSVRIVSPSLQDTSQIAASTLGGGKQSGPPAPRVEKSKPAERQKSDSGAKSSRGSLGRFELKQLLGQGGFARVYKAYDPQLDRYVALKIPIFGPQDKHRVQRFLTEAKAAARLHHPHIVPTYESGQADGRYYIAAQFVPGMTLARRLQEGREDPSKRPTFEEGARWVRDLADALAYAHGEGVVHRDIKPENIMLDEKGEPQIMDFGLAKRVNEDSSVTTDGTVLGTAVYMPPEQARGEMSAVGPHSDQYSLGAVLYELLTGQRPFDGPTHAVIAKVLNEDPPRPRKLRKDIPDDLVAICLKAMEKESGKRYGSAADLSSDLTLWIEGAPVRARNIRPWERAWKWARRHPAVASLTASIAALLVTALATISVALVFTVRAQWKAEQALKAVAREKDKNAELAGSLQQSVSDLQKTVAEKESATDRVREESEKNRQTSQVLATTVDQLKSEKGESDAARKRAEMATEESKKQQERADESAEQAKAEATARRKTARDTALELVQSYWEQANRLLDSGDYQAGINFLAKALEKLPDTSGDDTRIWDEILRMALAAEEASHPIVIYRHKRPGGLVTVADWFPVNKIAAVAGTTRLDVPELRVIDENGEIPGRTGHVLQELNGVTGIVYLDGLGYVVAHRTKPATLVPIDLRGKTEKPRPWIGPNAIVAAMQFGFVEDEPGRHIACLVASVSTNGAPSVTLVYRRHNPTVALPPWQALSLELPDNADTVQVGPEFPTALTASKRKLSCWHLGKRNCLAERIFDRDIASVTVCSHQRTVAVAFGDSTQLVSFPDLNPLDSPVSYPFAVGGVLLTDPGYTMVAAGAAGEIVAVDPFAGSPLCRPSAAQRNFLNLESVKGEFVVARTANTLTTWKLPLGKELWHLAESGEPAARFPPSTAHFAAFPDDAMWIIVAKGDSGMTWGVQRPTPAVRGAQATDQMHGGFQMPLDVQALAAHGTQRRFAVASSNGVYLYTPLDRPTTIGRRWKPDGILRDSDESKVRGVILGAVTPFLASGNESGAVWLWNCEKRLRLKRWQVGASPVSSLAFSADDGVLAAASGYSVELLSTAPPYNSLKSFSVPSEVTSLALSREGRRLIVGMLNGQALLLDAATGEQVGRPFEHGTPVLTVGFHASGRFAISVARDGGAQLLHVETAHPAGRFMRALENVRVVALNPSGSRMFLQGRLYDLPPPVSGSSGDVTQEVVSRFGARVDESLKLQWID